jgi:acid stress-induced BolA-like protein IbaG/YrbA
VGRPDQLLRIVHITVIGCDVEVAGDGHHWEAVIVSTAFQGKSKVQQHQLVYGALGERMREEIHALSMKTLTPDQWPG